MMLAALLAILAVVFLAPFLFRKVERNLETFLFVMGLLAVLASRVADVHLAAQALVEPIKISLAVLVFGLVFKFTRAYAHRQLQGILHRVPLSAFVFLVVVALGLLSGVITAIIASLLLVELVGALGLSRKAAVRLTIIACFAIGLGAALTPLGEPLSTLAIAKLKGEPHHASFFFLARLLGIYIIPGIIALGILAALLLRSGARGDGLGEKEMSESVPHALARAGKTYLFVMALILLGEGFRPVIDSYVVNWGGGVLYWANITSAALDNATLTAAEISPLMTAFQIKSALVALLVSGGMLIPGNIPNIVSAGKLRISSREWARLGVPLGMAMMLTYFAVLQLLG